MKQSHDDWPVSTNPFKPRDLNDQPPPESVGIAIPMKNGLKFFKLCFHSVRSFTDHPHLLTVVDNQSQFFVKSYLKLSAKNHHDFEVLRYDDDFNFAAEVNLAMRHMFQWPTVKYGLILNADAVVGPFWLSKLMATIQSNSRIGIVGPISNKANPEQMEAERRDQYTPALRVSGFCMLFRREVFEELGGFDEQFEGGGFEDWDFCERALRKNWKVVIDGHVHVHHFYRMYRREDYELNAKENQIRFFKKHPILMDYFQEIKQGEKR